MNTIQAAGVTIYTETITNMSFLNTAHHWIWDKVSRFDRRINTPNGAHLRGVFQPTMGIVHIAEYPADETGHKHRELLDGNSRLEAIVGGYLKAYPENLIAIVYKVPNKDTSSDIFRTIDSIKAADKAAHDLGYALKNQELTLKSSLLLVGSSTSINSAGGCGKDVYLNVATMRKGLSVLDSLGVERNHVKKLHRSSNLCCVGVVQALLEICNEYGHHSTGHIHDFFFKVNEEVSEELTDLREFLKSTETTGKGIKVVHDITYDYFHMLLNK